MAASVAFVAAVAGVTLGVLTLAGVTFQGSGSAEEGPLVGPSGNLLITANRDRLAICIDSASPVTSAPASLPANAKEAMQTALQEVARHPYWQRAGITLAPVVDVGCPSPPPPIGDPSSYAPIEGVWGFPVSMPSYYRVFVFVLDPHELQKLVGTSRSRRAPQELSCLGDSCAEITAALFLSVDELADPAFVTDNLEKATGLDQAGRP
jgi:hypothetical protein